MLRLLCVTAHPDDEAGNFGGTLLHYSERGVKTSVICLTAGQAATHRGNTTSDEELAAERRQEFTKSCKILKVSHCEIWNLPDAALDRCDFQSVVGRLVRSMRQIRPHVVITYGPDGSLTAHPDHGMAGLFATTAFHWAGRTNRFPEQLQDEFGNGTADSRRPWRPQKLYYCTAGFTLPERQPVCLPPSTARIDVSKYFQEKVRAFHAHQTQSPLFEIFEKHVSKHADEELFHLAAAALPQPARWETDLFEGVTDD